MIGNPSIVNRPTLAVRHSAIIIALSPWLATFGGCGGQNPADAVAAMNDSNIRKLANLYMSFQFRNGMRGPKDEEEFKSFIRHDMPSNKLKMMNVDPDRVDELFLSESNGQPFELIYGVSGSAMSVLAVVFEQPDESGIRRVGYTNGPVQTIDATQYAQLKEDPEKKIESTRAEPTQQLQ